ncbi:MAG: aspartyl/asparaginyl beta-hydroxylase domain-containing protein [Pseudomonadales bacterium]
MDIEIPLLELGELDIDPLRNAILGLPPEAWLDQQYRQQTYDVHRYTESVVLVFTDGVGWPEIEVSRQSGWDLLADVAVPVMQDIIARHYPAGGTIIRAMAAKLLVGGIIKPHTDRHPSFHHGHRIHIPITTNPRVRFMIDGRPYKLQVGQVYEINNQKQHSVMNKGTEDRITFIFDYVPPNLIDRSAQSSEVHR